MKTLLTFFIALVLLAATYKVSAQCDATFRADSTNLGYFNFTPSGYGNFHWDFGDGDTSDLREPQHSFPAVGTYNVCLTVTDSAGTCTNTSCQNVYVAPCQVTANIVTASYTYSISEFSVAFTNTSSSPYTPLTYSWVTFAGSPLTSTVANPVITFPAGSQYVWLTATDAEGCSGETAGYVQVNGNLPCNARYSVTPVSLGVYSFEDSFALSGYTYIWSFGDGTPTSTAFNPSHTYATNGTYTVCLIASNGTAGCSDTFCSPLQVQACGTYASFTDVISGIGGNVISFTSTSTTLNAPLTYAWSFSGGGSSSTSTQINPVITLSGSGTEPVSLTVTDANGCSASVSSNITYGVQSPGTIEGNINVATCPVTVYLILEDTIGHLTLMDSVQFVDTMGACIDSFYVFRVSVSGTYFVKAALGAGNPNYAGYLPTYFRDTLSWVNATPIYVTASSFSYAPINLIQGVNTGGPGFIGGWVSQGAGLVAHGQGNVNEKGLGDPLAGVQIDLTTLSGQAVAYTFTDANGEYRFYNLAYGTYKLFADELNKVPSPITVTISAQQPGDTTVDISINSHNATATDIVDLKNVSISRVYPDPVISDFNLDINCRTETNAVIKLIDLLGRTQLLKQVKLFSGANHIEINMDGIANGGYQLLLQTGNQNVAYKLIKIK